MPFCINCGQELPEGANFCSNCGKPMNETTPTKQRETVYDGKIHKCANCGCIITETTVVCPDCGTQITDREAISSVRKFKDQMMEIEKNNSPNFGILDVYMPASKNEKQKLNLIRSFPIPNTIDDILEFFLFSISNIDVSLSKKTLTNRINSANSIETGHTIKRTISDAWVSKMEQCYRKAELLFPDTTVFESMKNVYYEKLKELKIKIK